MANVLHKNNINQGTVQVHVVPPPIPIIRSKNDEISDKDCVKIKLCRESMSQKLDLY